MQLRTFVIKIVIFKGGHIMWYKWFPYLMYLFLKEVIRSLWEQILSFKKSSYFEKGGDWRESLLDPVVSLWCAYLFCRSGYAIAQLRLSSVYSLELFNLYNFFARFIPLCIKFLKQSDTWSLTHWKRMDLSPLISRTSSFQNMPPKWFNFKVYEASNINTAI